MFCHVTGYKFTDVLEEHTAFIFSVEEYCNSSALKLEGVCSSKTLANFRQTTMAARAMRLEMLIS
jgi:hypothetical protein